MCMCANVDVSAMLTMTEGSWEMEFQAENASAFVAKAGAGLTKSWFSTLLTG